MPGNLILTKEVAQIKMERIALEIAEELYGNDRELVIIGIAGSGMVIAEKMHELIAKLVQLPLQLISCNLNKKSPADISYSKDMDFSGKNILLVDDVSNSGRTMLYALKPLLQYHPRRIQTMALVERMHKSFPVKTDYIGLSIATTLQDHIQVEVQHGEVAGAFIV